MTIRTKRRGRRSLAAIAAALLMASVLAVVTGAPAQAANTSSEALVDTNDDGVGDAREFGGRDRYDTANRLAANFGKAEGLGRVPVAFVASGYMLVDAISVAGLAGFLDAPVLLTPSESLNGGVADFIEDYGVQTVHVLGGPAAVSDAVVTAIEGLANKPMVTRIYGDDRYATAAAIASQLGSGAAWCGGAEAAAILANGGDMSLAYAMAISPVANRLQLPLLLTASDELPSATEDFITDQDIEHVVIMGGESSVSDDVSAALTSAGVNTVTRIDGDTPAAASAALAKLATNGCRGDLGLVSANTVALVAESGLPDGVAASPILASSYQTDTLVPMLIVGDTLPASVSDYLAATPALSGTSKQHLNIVAIGGDAAVSPSVMKAALAAAASADALSVQITGEIMVPGSSPTEYKPPQAGDDEIMLRFSDNIVADVTDNPALTNLIRDNLKINGAPARFDTTGVISDDEDGAVDDACTPDAVEVTLASKLKAGDVISLAGGAKFGSAMDRRTVAGASVTVPAMARDTTAPVVNVIAIDATATGVSDVALVRFDSMSLDTMNNNDTVDADEIMITSTTTKVPAASLTLANNETIAANTADADGAPTGTDADLVAGDRITIKSGALVDEAGNKSRARTFTVLAAQASPRITAVTMSEQKHTAQAAATVPAGIAPLVGTAGIKIMAKMGGAADGAAGNGWDIAFDRATGWKDDAKAAVDIDVWVNAKDQLVSVRFNSGNAKFADLQSALEGNSAFDALFKVTLPAAADGGACGATANNPLEIAGFTRGSSEKTTGGMTAVAVEVRFNTYVATIDVTENLADDVFMRVRARYNDVAVAAAVFASTDAIAGSINGLEGSDLAARLVAAGGTNEPLANVANLASGAPATTVRYELVTNNTDLLPKVRDLVDTAVGTTDDDQVASGYAADVDGTVGVDEGRNAKSQVRIGQSSSVKAPAFAPETN
ncbi:cell wall-binding repeat-containing protein [Candidatus Poriferisodalis sp.]|uniref:cell wall-binding repeat-containing protein n=1 Tax=Candidatus Poriferisodalis sp. TaxID=3101277 RepID=UPI003D0AB30E